ncbi:hypothetical protein LCI18_007925 [Fusarium solani-melongenae]|uniref:Uncharacterized protein n=1 Tax=Fusarium solani subsp. cucurbitae TaxID=2747967 RepID=A0ACD3Z6Z7_FUSSC|nr:hypothetical protein LCI18_007925 [Fusarium solani-melongenae]
MSGLPLQWNLDRTVESAVQTLVGILKAASSDNVQGQALIACEKLGSTLAICDQTMKSVRIQAVDAPSSPTSTFLKTKVGFSRNDCANQLATTQAGLRFLALATAMITTMDIYAGAQALEQMLKDEQVPAEDPPPLPQLKDILATLAARAEQSNFTKSVLQYQRIVKNHLGHDPRHDGGDKALLVSAAPSPEVVAKLVGGNAKVGAAAPWVIAFVNWCLGAPPSVYLEYEEDPLWEQSTVSSSVNVIILKDDIRRPVEAIIHHQLEDITQLLGEFSGKTLKYMLGIDDYVDWLLDDLGFKRYSDIEFNQAQIRLLREVLGFAIPQILLNVKCGTFGRLGQIPNPVRWVSSLKSAANDFYCSPLPAVDMISKSCRMFLQGCDMDLDFCPPEPNRPVQALPLVSVHLKSLKETCECKSCCKSTNRSIQDAVGEEWCAKESFFRSLSFLITDIFAFSLYGCDSSLKVIKTQSREKNAVGFQRAIWKFLQNGTLTSPINPMDLLDWARNLAGHGGTKIGKEGLIMTYKAGQVIYPAIFESFEPWRQGYLQLYAIKGTLKLNKIPYDTVSSPGFPAPVERRGDPAGFPRHGPVSKPENLLEGFEFSWDVTPLDGKEIHAYMMLREKKGELVFKRDPLILLQSFANTLIMGNCAHDYESGLPYEDLECSLSVPWGDHTKAVASASKVDAVAVAGGKELRFFSLAAVDFAYSKVLRGDACLECCLDVCRRNGIHVLIL